MPATMSIVDCWKTSSEEPVEGRLSKTYPRDDRRVFRISRQFFYHSANQLCQRCQQATGVKFRATCGLVVLSKNTIGLVSIRTIAFSIYVKIRIMVKRLHVLPACGYVGCHLGDICGYSGVLYSFVSHLFVCRIVCIWLAVNKGN